MVSRKFSLQVAIISMMFCSTMAYTEVAPGLQQQDNEVRYTTNQYYDGSFFLVTNTATIANDLLFRGLSLSSEGPGVSNELNLTLNRGPMQVFTELQLYGYSSNFPDFPSQSGPSFNIADTGSTMVGAALGLKMFLNYCRDTSVALVFTNYRWPDALYLISAGNPNGSQFSYLGSTGGLNSPKPVNTIDLNFLWRSYHMTASFAHQSDEILAPTQPLKETWQSSWNNYYSFETPDYAISESIKIKAHYGYWKNVGISINASTTHPISKNLDLVLSGHNFKSFVWNPSSTSGITLALKAHISDRFETPFATA